MQNLTESQLVVGAILRGRAGPRSGQARLGTLISNGAQCSQTTSVESYRNIDLNEVYYRLYDSAVEWKANRMH